MPDVRSKLPVLPVCRVEGRARVHPTRLGG